VAGVDPKATDSWPKSAANGLLLLLLLLHKHCHARLQLTAAPCGLRNSTPQQPPDTKLAVSRGYVHSKTQPICTSSTKPTLSPHAMTTQGAMNRAQQAGKAPRRRMPVPRKARRSRQSCTCAAFNAIQQENAGQHSLA
jgi:hypothetical protein